MNMIADGQRTGYGLAKLRARYIRRAEVLSRDAEFRSKVKQYRDEWNARFLRYLLGAGVLSDTLPMPAHLERDLEAQFQNWERLELKYAATLDRPRDPDNDPEYDAYFREGDQIAGQYPDAWESSSQWEAWLHHLSITYFPHHDFYDPLPDDSWPPEYRFLAMALAADPRTIDDMDLLFPELRISIRGGAADESIHEGLYLPLYPGMAAQDLVQAASEIVDAVNEHYAGLTPRARMLSLRANGLKHQEIADRLGLNVKTVADALRKSDESGLKNP